MIKRIMHLFSSQKSQHFLVIILTLVAFVLGALVVRAYSFDVQTFLGKLTSQKQNASQPQNSQGAPPPSQMRQLPADLTADERALLTPPAPDASKEEKDKHFEVIKKLAKEADILDLKGCTKPDPLVMKLKDGSEFKVKSTDGESHTIVINQDYTFEVPKDTTATFKAAFPFGQGAYGYLCDSEPGVVGFFLVDPK